MSAWFCTLLLLIILILYIYKRVRNVHQYFERSGIPFVKPRFIFGEDMDYILNTKELSTKYKELHRKLQGCRFGGAIFSGKAAFIIRDPELFNTMLTKDYNYFQPTSFITFETENPIELQTLSSLHGTEWKVRRQKLIRFFSNKSLKLMLPVMENSMDKLIPFFEKLCKREFVLLGEISQRSVTDLTTCIIFGNEESWLENPNSQNCKLIKDLSHIKKKTIFHMAFPNLAKFLIKLGLGFNKFSFHNEEIIETFAAIVLNKLWHREKNNIRQNDFLNFLIESKINESAKPVTDRIMSDHFIAASVLQLLDANLLATIPVLNTCLAELSMNQNVQEKLRKEIKEALCNEEKLSFEVLNKMTYLDMIISETLRRRNGFNRRRCFQNYRIPGTDVVIPKGSFITMSVECIHMDEKFYEKPKEFYPEHFSIKAKSKRPKWAYVPFGNGLRKCIGNRLADLQLKIVLVYLINNFKLEVSPKSEKPIDMRRIYSLLPAESSNSLEIIFQKI